MSIVIRRMNGDDKKALFDLLSDPLVMQFLEEPYSEKKTEQFLLSAGLSSDPLIYAVEKESKFVGYVIYHDFDENSLEIGWVLSPKYWGKGIASFLTEQMIAKSKTSGKQLVIECVPGNDVTIHIAEKYGFRNEGLHDGLLRFRL